MEAREAQIAEEIEQILTILTELTGLSSRWSGHVELVPDADFKGRKPFSCHIRIDAALALLPERWSTLIHEALHSLSAGYIASDFRMLPGWEEGVIERLQRLYRPVVLARLGITVDDAIFLEDEREHHYNPYIGALEQLRVLLNIPEAQFYLDLLRTPIRERPGYLLGLGRQLTGEARTEFLMAYSKANSVLKGFLLARFDAAEEGSYGNDIG
jgi:hypothetical protein